MYLFPSDITTAVPERFTDPFRYFPHPLVKAAAEEVMSEIDRSEMLSEHFKEGKMLGILVVRDTDGRLGYLRAFSGNVGGRSVIEGFVPPIFDLLDPSGHFKIREAEITAINTKIAIAEKSPDLQLLYAELENEESRMNEEIGLLKARMAISKHERDEIRREVSDPSRLSELIRESQFEKAELKRLKQGWSDRIESIRKTITDLESDIHKLKHKRAAMSDELQRWIFDNYIVHNALGEKKSIWDIFSANGLIPPGGTGECAAPKLLEHAYRNGLHPIAMGEFWYGESPATTVRTHGHFYPSCTSKCGPLLRFMMEGLSPEEDSTSFDQPEMIYEDDDLIAVEKPSGMPSVPGLDGRESVFDILKDRYAGLNTVHRLDMDTSGIILFAKTEESAVNLQRQFENHSISKVYHARLSVSQEGKLLKAGDKGRIELPLSPDFDERPRQKVDAVQGKEATTEYEIIKVNEDGTIEIAFYPLTGRTHQLRVHSAHISGLGRPIVGDRLYGGSPSSRLHLHAHSIRFRHPSSGIVMTLTSSTSL